jgi:DNA-binding response OmpR family regulator
MTRLLFIDDDLDSLELYSDMLSPTIKVTPCQKANEGIELAKKESFDAIMLDIYLPGTNGFEILEAIRRDGTNQRTPVFFISAENTVANKLKAFGMGSEDFISRHMEPEEVLIRIQSRLEKNEERPSTVLKLGDIEIEQESLVVRRSGEIIELTQTEYRLLLLLIRGSHEDPKKVFETNEIIQFVWPMDPESVFPRTLATHLTNLRKKVNSSKVKFKAVRLSGITVILSE